MNIIGYAKKYSSFTFKGLPFNEVDSLIFSELAYINFDLLLKKGESIKLKNLKIEDPTKFYYGSVDHAHSKVLLELMMKAKRYKDITIYNPVLYVDKKTYEQFFAITFIFPNNEAYIAYRGTDISILGWKEDFMIAYQDDFPSQKRAAKYLKEVLSTLPGNFYLGGHSKGGNLAIYSALSLKEKERLIKVYSFDGPGLRTNVENDIDFLISEGKVAKYLTNNDVVGVVYNRIKSAKIVYATGLLLGGHDPFSWKVRNKSPELSLAKDRTIFSKKHEEAMMNWMHNMSDEDKNLACNMIMDFFSESETVYDLLKNLLKNLTKGSKIFAHYTKEEKQKGRKIITKLVGYYAKAYNPIKKRAKKK